MFDAMLNVMNTGNTEVSATAVHCNQCDITYDEQDTEDCPGELCVADRIESQARLEIEAREVMRENLYDRYDLIW